MMGWRRRSRFAMMGAVLLAGIMLSGCAAVRHVSAELRNGTVRFANCEDFAFDSVDVSVMSKKSPYGTQTVWHSVGASEISGPVQVGFGVDPSGFSSSIGPKSFDVGASSIEVLFQSSNPNSAPGPSGTFDGAKLVEGRWLNWNGNIVSTPCKG